MRKFTIEQGLAHNAPCGVLSAAYIENKGVRLAPQIGLETTILRLTGTIDGPNTTRRADRFSNATPFPIAFDLYLCGPERIGRHSSPEAVRAAKYPRSQGPATLC